MKSLEEVRAEFLDENGMLDINDVPALNDRLREILTKEAAARTITPGEHVQILEGHFGAMVFFLLQQMADLYVEVQSLSNAVQTLIDGQQRPFDVEGKHNEFIEATLPAVQLDRLSRTYDVVHEKTRPKLVTP